MAKRPQSDGKKASVRKSAPRKRRVPKDQAATARADIAAFFADDRRVLFVEQYLIDRNGTQAAIRAGYAPTSAPVIASTLLRHPLVQERMNARLLALQQRTEITQDRVLMAMWANATADINEIVQHRRVACRFCHGEGHEFQWTSEREWRAAYDAHAADFLLRLMGKDGTDDIEAKIETRELTGFGFPEKAGGFGYRRNIPPHPDCPECAGEGQSIVHITDSRDLSPQARAAFEGVKETRQGVEVKMVDRQKALEQVGKHLGMFKEKVELDATDQLLKAAQALMASTTTLLPGALSDDQDGSA